jgi:hypothetical protein
VEAAGALVIGPVHTVARALALVDSTAIYAAILDYRLETQTTLPVAEHLTKAHVPLLFHTSSSGERERSYPPASILVKPTGRMQVIAEVRRLIKGQ